MFIGAHSLQVVFPPVLSQKCPIRPKSGTVWWDTLLFYLIDLTPVVPLSRTSLRNETVSNCRSLWETLEVLRCKHLRSSISVPLWKLVGTDFVSVLSRVPVSQERRAGVNPPSRLRWVAALRFGRGDFLKGVKEPTRLRRWFRHGVRIEGMPLRF